MIISAVMIRIARKYPVIGPDADLDCKKITLLIVFGTIAGVT
jgi:hypothetical protein